MISPSVFTCALEVGESNILRSFAGTALSLMLGPEVLQSPGELNFNWN